MASIIAPAAGKSRIAEEILADLPEWFGIPAATANYVKEAEALPMLACLAPDQTPLGFLSLKQTSGSATEIYAMGVRRLWHRQGIGRMLVQAASVYAEDHGAHFLTVKTLAASKPDKNYAITRIFYESAGFLPVEEFSALWGADNPCLFMIRPLGKRPFSEDIVR